MLLFAFLSLQEECLSVDTILLLPSVLIPTHYLPYQNLFIVCQKIKANLPIAFSLRWSPLTPKWFCVKLLWQINCILRLSNCSCKLATTHAAFVESARSLLLIDNNGSVDVVPAQSFLVSRAYLKLLLMCSLWHY